MTSYWNDKVFYLIETYPKYAISKQGEVINQRTRRTCTIYLDKDGYPTVKLHDADSKVCTKTVHRLVALAFIPNPDNLPQVNHIDRDKTNNHVSNLEWCTHQYNSEYSKAITVVLLNPDDEVTEIYNLKKFCRENKLNQAAMHGLTTGRVKFYKGWRPTQH